MKSRNKQPEKAETLRKRAQDILRERAVEAPEDREAQWPEEARQMLHELRVHQIELEMQNEELREAHLELDVIRARYFDLYELAPVGYATVSEKGLILEANLTAANQLGMARRDLVKQPITRFILKEDQDTFYQHRNLLFETGTPQVCELRMQKPDKGVFHVQLDATVVQDADGTPMCRVTMSDISERKLAEEQAYHLQKAESLSRMAGAIAHHFNNHLAVVIGNLELTLNEFPLSGLLTENLTEAMAAARRAVSVSSLMLTYLGQTFLKKEPMDMGEICRRSLPLLRATLPETIRLETDFPSSGPTVSGIANQMQQILTNLITNAWESCDGGGTVELSVKTVSAEDIPRSHRYPIDWQQQHTAYACLEVRDTGCGIPDTDIEKIFDPFFTTKFTGRGLGLAVVLGILKAHRGAIAVKSEPGRGSLFRAFLPLATEASEIKKC